MDAGEVLDLASPYSLYPGGHEAAASVVSVLAGRLAKLGLNVFRPIAHSHTIAVHSEIDPLAPDLWMRMDRAVAIHAYGLIVANMDGWEKSHGVAAEIGWFRAMPKKMIWLLDCETLELTPMFPGRHS